MVQFVVDTSVLVQAFVEDKESPHVLTLIRELAKKETTLLYVPEFCILECTNVLWKRVKNFGLPLEVAITALDTLLNTSLTIELTAPLAQRALIIGLEHNLAIYDSVYIAMAEKLGVPLITVDARQAKAAQVVGIALKSITDFAPSL